MNYVKGDHWRICFKG